MSSAHLLAYAVVSVFTLAGFVIGYFVGAARVRRMVHGILGEYTTLKVRAALRAAGTPDLTEPAVQRAMDRAHRENQE